MHVVMVTGAAPGLGKSTLSRRLAGALGAVLFEEADILERDEFRDVIASFRSRGRATLDEILDATRRYVATLRDGQTEIVVQDVLFPYLPSLLAWGHTDEEIVELCHALREACGDLELVQVHLVGDPASSLPRAMEREGEGWLDAWMKKVATYADLHEPVTDLDSLIAHLDRVSMRTVSLLPHFPWPVVVVDADLGAEHAARVALEALDAMIVR